LHNSGNVLVVTASAVCFAAKAGKVVPGSGGVRVIYYFKRQDDEIWLLTIYSKNEVENIPSHVLRQIAKEIENV